MAGITAGFRQRFGGLLYLMLFVSMLTVSLGVLSVAPDDFASECTIFAEPGTFNNPNEKVLLDTQFYPSKTLLTIFGEDRLWTSLDFDMLTGTGTGKVRKHAEVIKRETEKSIRVSGCFVSLYMYAFAVVD